MSDAPTPFQPLRDLRVATAFLTRIPTGWIDGLSKGDLAGAAWAFPLVGLAVGALAGGALYLASGLNAHPLACAFIGLGVQALVTGALHEDGLADVADGLGGHDKARILEIMRDSRIGSFGVLALVFSVGVRAASLAGVPGPGTAWIVLISAAAVSRAGLPLLMHVMPPARPDGLSKNAGRPSLRVALLSLALGLAALFALLPWSVAVTGLLLALPAAALIVYWAGRRLGGQTGDVLGAVQQVTETAVLIAASGWSLSVL